MVKKGENAGKQAPDLLNFHFARAPPPRNEPRRSSSSNHHQQGNRRGNSRNNSKSNSQQYRRTKEDRASARRKASQQNFYLHSSSDHAFVLTRRGRCQQQPYSFDGPDAPVSWESVLLVKYLASVEQEQCPICLDTFTCPRITKCGHNFCLTCVLHYLQTCAASAAAAGYSKNGPKCPCCAIPLYLEDLRPVQFMVAIPPAVNRPLRLVKLHRFKACPAPFLPRPTCQRHASPHAAPCQTDPDAAFCKFNYVEPVVYQQHLQHNVQELESQQVCDEIEALCRSLALERVQRELQFAMEQAQEEMALQERFQNPAAGMYQDHPRQLLASTTSHDGSQQQQQQQQEGAADDDATSSSQQAAVEDNGAATASQQEQSTSSPEAGARRHRLESIGSEGSTQTARGRSESFASSVTESPTRERTTRKKKAVTASMFLDQDESAFYQTEDGALCFLSGFNMNCLRAEFSPSIPEEEEQNDSPQRSAENAHKRMPLPDAVEGRVLEVDKVHLTPDLRSRLRFLAHVPVYTDICFVEISLGDLLSQETKKKFKKEFQKRKQTRQNRINAEKRADARSRKLEEARIDELKARMQRIDPEDEFFHAPEPELPATGEDFGPALSTSRTSQSAHLAAAGGRADPAAASFSFSQITREGGMFPSLSSSAPSPDFPSLGSSPTTSRTAVPSKPAWGPSKPAPKKEVEPASPPQKPMAPKGKKKGRGKKVVLFSTGSHRGGAY